jgi:hypothetical protein
MWVEALIGTSSTICDRSPEASTRASASMAFDYPAVVFRWAIWYTLPTGSRIIARRSPYGVSSGSSKLTAPAWRALRYVLSASST